MKYKVSVWTQGELQAIFIFLLFNGNFGVYMFSYGRGKFLLLLGDGIMGQCNVTNVAYRTHVALRCGCSVPVAKRLDSSAMGFA